MKSVHDLSTPALVVDTRALDYNIDLMARTRPGYALRPHIKAFKSTAMARHVHDRGGHGSFCCATLREMEGMVDAGLGTDLLLANETLDTARLAELVRRNHGRTTVAVDSAATIEVAAAARSDVLIDVDVGMPRCGCEPRDAAALADLAAANGVVVRGVMGYEGHAMGNDDRCSRQDQVLASMELLRRAHDQVGGISSAGGTGTYDLHDWVDEVQAGSYLLMDSHYARLDLPFRQALFVVATVISTNESRGWAVTDAGLKAFGMDHGNPSIDGHEVFFCSDEHTTFMVGEDGRLPRVGTKVRMTPAHVDPTVALHQRMHLLDGDEVVDCWDVDLRNW